MSDTEPTTHPSGPADSGGASAVPANVAPDATRRIAVAVLAVLLVGAVAFTSFACGIVVGAHTGRDHHRVAPMWPGHGNDGPGYPGGGRPSPGPGIPGGGEVEPPIGVMPPNGAVPGTDTRGEGDSSGSRDGGPGAGSTERPGGSGQAIPFPGRNDTGVTPGDGIPVPGSAAGN